MTRDEITLGLALGTILLAGQARADSLRCIERDTLVARLAAQYGESLQSTGLADGNRLMEVFASPQTGTWTLVVTAPTGLSCLYAAGEHFERFEAPAPGDPA